MQALGYYNKVSFYPQSYSEAKSQTIRRMQSNLETWDRQLEEIATKKTHNGEHAVKPCVLTCLQQQSSVTAESLARSEIEKRDQQLEELTGQYNRECGIRRSVEQERENLTTELVFA